MGKPIKDPIGKDILTNLYVVQELSAIKIANGMIKTIIL